MEIEHDDTNSVNDSVSTTSQNATDFQSQPVNGDNQHDNTKLGKDKLEVSDCNVGASTSKKREYPTGMEKSAAKVIKLNCDNPAATDEEPESPAEEESTEENACRSEEPDSSELAEVSGIVARVIGSPKPVSH